jgi:hypothetical protein
MLISSKGADRVLPVGDDHFRLRRTNVSKPRASSVTVAGSGAGWIVPNGDS